jgi:hypothetical protein
VNESVKADQEDPEPPDESEGEMIVIRQQESLLEAKKMH